MTKTNEKSPYLKETKDKEHKGKSNLFGRVKKVVKKSRRKLGEEKFEKELQRTIEFLAQLQVKLDNSSNGQVDHEPPEKVEKKSVKRDSKKVEKKAARSVDTKAKSTKKGLKKTPGNGNGVARKAKDTAPMIKDAPAAESVIALQAEASSLDQ